MKTRVLLLAIICLLPTVYIDSQTAVSAPQKNLKWQQATDGIYICEDILPDTSVVGDSKCIIVKIDPSQSEFHLLSASEYGKKSRTAEQWGNEFSMNLVFNAGMYYLSNQSVSRGYMQNFKHKNNPKINGGYNIFLAFNPKSSQDPSFKIYDLSCDSFSTFSNKYNSFSQIMRMVDCSGKGLEWKKRAGQKCSMIFIASDNNGIIYLLFVRSPYTHNYMINYLLTLPIEAKMAGYLEGGPETSLFLKSDSLSISKWGSYVSKTYETDKNDHYWAIPNVIGVCAKKK